MGNFGEGERDELGPLLDVAVVDDLGIGEEGEVAGVVGAPLREDDDVDVGGEEAAVGEGCISIIAIAISTDSTSPLVIS